MKDQNLLWGSSADTNYLILVKNTTNERDSQLLCCFFRELSIQLTSLHLFSAFNYFANLGFPFFFSIDTPVFVLF